MKKFNMNKKILKMNKNKFDKYLTMFMIILIYIIVEIFMKYGLISSLVKGLLVPFCTYAIAAVGLNLVVGISGELSLGHAGFMCVGAFMSSIFTRYMKFMGYEGLHIFFIGLLIGVFFAALIGFLIGIPVLRLRGDYLAIVTLAFGEIIKNIFNAIYLGFDKSGAHISLKNTMDLKLSAGGFVVIKGAQGITGTPNYSNFTIGVIFLLIVSVISYNLIYSRTGRNVKALRDNITAGESVGIKVTKTKLTIFTISSAIAGLAGVLYAHNLNTLTALPKNFGYNMSIQILVFVVLGGMGNIRGSIISAVILTLLPEVLRGLQDYRMLIYAIVLILVMLFTQAPNLINLKNILYEKVLSKKKEASTNE